MIVIDLPLEHLILLGSAALSCILLIIYYVVYFTHFSKLLISQDASTTIPVSVIVAARNELKNLEKNIPLILNQDHPNFELIIINDGSFDGTKDYLKQLALDDTRVKVVTLELNERFQKGKKFALTMGIKAATHEHLLFTDADCQPNSNQWIKAMTSSFEQKSIVLGYSPLLVKNNILGSLISYETFHTGLQYIGYAKKGIPYMGVGRNLAYTKATFFANKGFARHQHIMSGDDDLFVQEVANKNNTAICIDPDSFTLSQGEPSWSKWSNQKRRHISTSSEYKGKFKRLLGFYSLAQIVLYLAVILCCIVSPHLWYLAIAILTLKWIIQWLIIWKPSQLLNAKKVGYVLPYYDILYTIYLMLFGIFNLFKRPETWK
ncbi:MAG: glycosyltransferase involved in cell wall biosynthesis [Bacteroidia bacterium]|jgi:glycosyltransferase involved in cell wall biosynthesis